MISVAACRLAPVALALLVAACGGQPSKQDAAMQQPEDMAFAVYDFTQPAANPDFSPSTSPDLAAASVDLAGADLTVVPDFTVVDLAGADLEHPAQGDIASTQAYANGNAVNGTVAPGTPVVVVTQTTPRGAAMTVTIHWTIDGFKTDNAVVEMLDTKQPAPQNDQWYGIIPGQAKGATVTWYVVSLGWDGSTKYWSNFGKNFSYSVQ